MTTVRTASVADQLLIGTQHGAEPPVGAVVAIVEGEKTLLSTAGAASLEQSHAVAEAMTEQHVHDLASVSKVLTTLTMLRLRETGALRLTNTLGDFFGPSAGAHGAVTLDDLLRHRSGMRPWWPLYLAEESPLESILALPPSAPAGTKWQYSDLGMQALGAVIAHVTGQPFESSVQELTLSPLSANTVTPAGAYSEAPVASGGLGDAVERDMIASGDPYSVSADVRAAAAGFAWREHIIRDETADCNAFHAFGGVAGHAGWFSDAAGLLHVAAALADPVLAAELADVHGPQPAGAFRQGTGVRVYEQQWRGQQRTFVGHPGFTGTFIAAAPETASAPRVLMVVLTNRLHGAPPPARRALAPVDDLWRRAVGAADRILHEAGTGDST
ncbi:serine hydrolase [uncultured Agrococcus sp.]|uniref:serine hydrolase domain-containing protein n=1 Tax=uncultured Agrococcus sp. TaxID=382258 RepID=UPI0025CD5D74|nr:serine hydrolase domain-containing protein [uncultured Agrococcus sp.]